MEQLEGGLVQCDVTVVRDSTGQEWTFTVNLGGVLRIGRGSLNDVVLDYEGVSEYHAEIFLRPVGADRCLCVRDNSKNGTGVRPGPLAPEAEQRLGRAWETLQRGTFRVLEHGWQLVMPLRTRKGGNQAPVASTETVTVRIGGKVTEDMVDDLDGELWDPEQSETNGKTEVSGEPNGNAAGLHAPAPPPPPPDLGGLAFEEPPPPPRFEGMPPPPPPSATRATKKEEALTVALASLAVPAILAVPAGLQVAPTAATTSNSFGLPGHFLPALETQGHVVFVAPAPHPQLAFVHSGQMLAVPPPPPPPPPPASKPPGAGLATEPVPLGLAGKDAVQGHLSAREQWMGLKAQKDPEGQAMTAPEEAETTRVAREKEARDARERAKKAREQRQTEEAKKSTSNSASKSTSRSSISSSLDAKKRRRAKKTKKKRKREKEAKRMEAAARAGRKRKKKAARLKKRKRARKAVKKERSESPTEEGESSLASDADTVIPDDLSEASVAEAPPGA